MIKKSIYLLSFIFSIFMSACSAEVDEIFDKAASDRIDEALKANQSILTGATNGWLMEYYPASSLAYGGYNVLMKFEGENVTISSELGKPSEVAESAYRLKEQAGPVLTFDTYNPLFHPFADPDPSAGTGIGNPGLGMEGDYEFLIMEATPSKVILKGKKTGNKIVMTPLGKDVIWKDYLAQIELMRNNIEQYFSFKYTITGVAYDAKREYKTLTVSVPGSEGEVTQTLIPYITTVDGMKFYEPVEFFGVSTTELIYDKSRKNWKSLDGMVVLESQLPTPVEIFYNYGPWYLTYENMIGSTSQAEFKKGYEVLFGKSGHFKDQKLDIFGVGPNVIYTNFGIHFATDKFDGSEGSYEKSAGFLGLGYTKVQDNAIGLYLDGTGTQPGGEEMLKSKIVSFMAVGTSVKVFIISVDNVLKPTKLTLTDTSDKNNKFMLIKELTSFGYDSKK